VHPTPKLQKSQINQQEIKDMPRMRGQVADSLVEPRTKSKFDKVGATKLEACMQNIRGAQIEEIDWSQHWHNFTTWGMEASVWKDETNFLTRKVSTFFGCPSNCRVRWLEGRSCKVFVSRYHNGNLWLEFPVGITGRNDS
jgi:hypothetical protein